MRTFEDLPFLTITNCPPQFVMSNCVADVACLAGPDKGKQAVILTPDIWSDDVRALFGKNTRWALPERLQFDRLSDGRFFTFPPKEMNPMDIDPIVGRLGHDLERISGGIMAAISSLKSCHVAYNKDVKGLAALHRDDEPIFASLGLNVGGMVLVDDRENIKPYECHGADRHTAQLARHLEDDQFHAFRLPPGYLSVGRGTNNETQSGGVPHAGHPMPMPPGYAATRQWLRFSFKHT